MRSTPLKDFYPRTLRSMGSGDRSLEMISCTNAGNGTLLQSKRNCETAVMNCCCAGLPFGGTLQQSRMARNGSISFAVTSFGGHSSCSICWRLDVLRIWSVAPPTRLFLRNWSKTPPEVTSYEVSSRAAHGCCGAVNLCVLPFPF